MQRPLARVICLRLQVVYANFLTSSFFLDRVCRRVPVTIHEWPSHDPIDPIQQMAWQVVIVQVGETHRGVVRMSQHMLPRSTEYHCLVRAFNLWR